ncbi:alpha-actinin A [Biomphalaria glabrata]|nr:alpha-actinin A [Biomphalaria glabrata]
MIGNMMENMSRNITLNKVDESVLQVEGQIDQSDKIVSHAKGGINSLGKEQLPGQDCGCTNSGDGGAGDWRAVCDCVVGKSGGDDFQNEKCDNDCCDDLNGMCRIERKETNEETREVCYVPEVFVPGVPVTSTSVSRTDQDNVGSASKLAAVDFKDLCLSVSIFDENPNHESLKTFSVSLPWMSSSEIANTGPNNGQDRNNKFDLGSGIRENSMLGNCIQAIDMNCICGVLGGQCPCQENQLQDLNLTEMCTSAHFSESDLNGGELIPAKPDVVVDEHYKDVSWAYLTDEAEKEYVLETMATSGPTTVSRDVHGKGQLTQHLRTTTLESTVIATTSTFVMWLATLTSTNSPCVSWLASATIIMRSKQRPPYRLKRRLANWKKRKR